VECVLLERTRDPFGGLPLGGYFDGYDDALLVCATEKRTAAEMEQYGQALTEVLGGTGRYLVRMSRVSNPVEGLPDSAPSYVGGDEDEDEQAGE